MISRLRKIINVLTATVDFMVRMGYRCTPSYQRDQLSIIRLERPRIYRPTADINTILQWEKVFDRYAINSVDDNLNKVLTNLLVTKELHEADFDFSRIQSLSASKSFGNGYENKINGSWFKDLAAWGEGMFPDERLSALDMSDWLDNIWHIEHEGFHKGRAIHVYHYEWFDRYLASNSGGSHHAALVVHQIKNQGMKYSREAEITSYKIDESVIDDLAPYYCFITGTEAISANFSDCPLALDWILKSFVANTIYTFKMNATENNCTLFFIPKSELNIPRVTFENWLAARTKANEVILFKDILKNHSKFCITPYLHELRSIYLGDPTRHNDTLAKKM